MSFRPSDLTVAVANPDDRLAIWVQNSTAWASSLTLPTYLTRKLTLANSPLTRNAIFFKTYFRSVSSVVMSSCEAIPKPVLFREMGGDVKEDKGFGVASVFTGQAWRKRGVAKKMLKEVRGELDREGGVVSVLWSDIGDQYYAKLGWKPLNPPQMVWKASDIPEGKDEVSIIRYQDNSFQKLLDEGLLEKSFRSRFEEESQGKQGTVFGIIPTRDVLDWAITRTILNAADPQGIKIPVDIFGVRVNDAVILWSQDFKANKLKVLIIANAQESGVLGKLLRAAGNEARRAGLKNVVVWDWKSVKGDFEVLGTEEVRGDSIPSAQWKEGEEREISWIGNEFYAWC